jgi:hypothetical protein
VNIPGPETRALQMGPKIQNEDFLENRSDDFDSISGIHRDHIRK